MNLGPYQEDPLADNIIPLAIFPILAILCYMFYPEESPTTILVGSLFIALMIFIAAMLKIKKWHYYLSVRMGVLMVYFDCAILFFALMLGRVYENSITALMFIGLFLITAFLGHKFHHTILSELNSPKTKFGKFIVFFGFFGSAIGAGIGYWSVNSFGVHLFGPIIYMLLLILIAMFHANFQQTAFRQVNE